MTTDQSPVYGRPSAELKAAAVAVLAAMGKPRWSMDTFLVRCLVALTTKTDETIDFLADCDPQKRPVGRPRKADPIAESASEIPAEPKPASKKPAPEKRPKPDAPAFTSPAEPVEPKPPTVTPPTTQPAFRSYSKADQVGKRKS